MDLSAERALASAATPVSKPFNQWGPEAYADYAADADCLPHKSVVEIEPHANPSARHFEIVANLLAELEPYSADFSKGALISQGNQSDFDSAIPRFESWRPSQVS
jgi:hypothetical protein